MCHIVAVNTCMCMQIVTFLPCHVTACLEACLDTNSPPHDESSLQPHAVTASGQHLPRRAVAHSTLLKHATTECSRTVACRLPLAVRPLDSKVPRKPGQRHTAVPGSSHREDEITHSPDEVDNDHDPACEACDTCEINANRTNDSTTNVKITKLLVTCFILFIYVFIQTCGGRMMSNFTNSKTLVGVATDRGARCLGLARM